MLLLVYSSAALKVNLVAQEPEPKAKMNNYGFPEDTVHSTIVAPHQVVETLFPGMPAVAAAFNPESYGRWGTSIIKESAQDEKTLTDLGGSKTDQLLKDGKTEHHFSVGDKDWKQPAVTAGFEGGLEGMEQRSRFGDFFAHFVNALNPVDSHKVSAGYGEYKHDGNPGQGHGNHIGEHPSMTASKFGGLLGAEREKSHYYVPLNPPSNAGYENTNIMQNGRDYLDAQHGTTSFGR